MNEQFLVVTRSRMWLWQLIDMISGEKVLGGKLAGTGNTGYLVGGLLYSELTRGRGRT